ncbi:MAG: GGDEF domain-containing protein [Methylococcales bacterium]|nr:GGDEF domain-containing protein [Methylococcales bacterium]
MKNKAVNLAIVSNNTFEAKKVVNLQHYDISTALQTTLNISELIHIFSTKIQELIPHNSFVYNNETFDLEIKKGITAKNSLAYALKVEDMELGNLKIMRTRPFKNEELTLLESLLCSLIYPLQNATLYKQALSMAFTDPLTKTFNRAALEETLQREIQLAHRRSNHLSVIFLDIDHFKDINDIHGHEGGDIALASAATCIKDALRGSDVIFRYGGEEFVILLSDTNLDGAQIIAERICKRIEQHTIAYGVEILKLTASLGISSLRGNDTYDSLVKRADDAMYLAKENGRNQIGLESSAKLI